jgi:hypothetical protein
LDLWQDSPVPDWTYQPLRGPMAAVLGLRGSQRAAVALLAQVATLPGGRLLASGLGHTSPPPEARTAVSGVACPSPCGASVGVEMAAGCLRALPPLGAGLIEIGPLGAAELAALRLPLKRRSSPVAIRVAASGARAMGGPAAEVGDLLVVEGDPDPDIVAAAEEAGVPVLFSCPADRLGPASGRFGVLLREASPELVARIRQLGYTVVVAGSDPAPARAAELVEAGAEAVLATGEALIEAGPGWFHRATDLILERARTGAATAPASASRTAWLAGVGLGLGMIAGGLGAAAVTLGPVLLPYDAGFLGLGRGDLDRINRLLVPFLQHDRVTLAGTMVTLGILYAGLSYWGIRRGLAWARDTVLASCLVGFPTILYFLSFHYLEPVHLVMAVVLFPLFVVAVWRRPGGAQVGLQDSLTEHERRPALVGQLLMVATGLGLTLGGLTISVVGLSAIFVPSDLTYMGTSAALLGASDPHLLGFIAHDRAGFGGALISAGVAITLLAAWGWREGAAWLWWSLLAGACVGFGSTIWIHFLVGYVDFGHLAPVYAVTLLTAASLVLSASFLLKAPVPAPPPTQAGRSRAGAS